MKKKFLAIMLSSLMIAGMLTGCGKEEPASSNSGLSDYEVPIDTPTTDPTTPTEDKEPADQTPVEEPEPENIEGKYRSELTNEWIDEELKDQRPIAVMVDNELKKSGNTEHYGVNYADVVYEMVNSTANGRVTRLMCIVKDYEKVEKIGNVRSVRTTNFPVAFEYDAIILHDGGPFYIENFTGLKQCDHLSGGFARFDNGLASEFTEYVTWAEYPEGHSGNPNGLQKRLESSKFQLTYRDEYYDGPHFVFADKKNDLSDEKNAKSATSVNLHSVFPHNNSELNFNSSTGLYEYTEYSQLQKDPQNNNEVTAFENVILQKCIMTQLDDHGYMNYSVIGSGDGFYCTEGKYIPITWEKSADGGAWGKITHYYSKETGEEIELNTGKTYVAIIPADTFDQVSIK